MCDNVFFFFLLLSWFIFWINWPSLPWFFFCFYCVSVPYRVTSICDLSRTVQPASVRITCFHVRLHNHTHTHAHRRRDYLFDYMFFALSKTFHSPGTDHMCWHLARPIPAHGSITADGWLLPTDSRLASSYFPFSGQATCRSQSHHSSRMTAWPFLNPVCRSQGDNPSIFPRISARLFCARWVITAIPPPRRFLGFFVLYIVTLSGFPPQRRVADVRKTFEYPRSPS